MAEIRRVQKEVEPLAREQGAVVYPLHGSLPAEDQDRALRPDSRRKIILATNIAETSLTIDGVTTVIDSGLARVAHHDAARGFDRLDLGRISQASAAQRAGRAGRTGPGRCIRLWSQREERGMDPFEVPEVHRVDLCGTVLALHSWGVRDAREFAWFEPPAADRIEAAQRLLAGLGALDRDTGRISEPGKQMLGLPVHPRLARLLMAAGAEGRLEQGAALAALLSEKDMAVREPTAGPNPAQRRSRPASERGLSDLLPRLDWLAEAEHARFSPSLRSRGIDPVAARQVARVRDELVRLAARFARPRSRPGRPSRRRRVPAQVADPGLPRPGRPAPRGGGDRGDGRRPGRAAGPDSIVREGELFLALDPREERRQGTLELQVRLASAVRLEWLEELMPDLLRRERAMEFDPARERVVGVSRLWYQDLLLREDANQPVDPAEASGVLAEALRPRASDIFTEDPAAAIWLARYAFVTGALPELDWPEIGEAAFVELLELICQGRTKLEEVRRADKVAYLQSRLTPRSAPRARPGGPALTRGPQRPPDQARPMSPTGRRSSRSGSRSSSAGPRPPGWPGAASRSCSISSVRTTARCRSPRT